MYYLGVDGGGSSTRAVLADAGRKTVRACRLGPGNVTVIGRSGLLALMREIQETLLPAGKTGTVRHSTLALAGIGRPAAKETAAGVISAAGIGRFTLLTDAEMLHFSIFRHSPGISLTAGTGSVCLVKGDDTPCRQLGGWGYLLGDEGSGFDLGRQAIRQCLLEAEQEVAPSRMAAELLDLFAVASSSELLSRIYAAGNPQALVASAGRLVLEMAKLGEGEAGRIVDSAASALLSLVRRGMAYLGRVEVCRVGLAGGVLQPGTLLRERFCKLAQETGFTFEVVEPEMTPVAAAVLYSFEQAGETVPPNVLNQLKGISD